jgi:hypothetical protein
MKTEEQWKTEMAGEISLRFIRAIQADALDQAVSLLTANADSPSRGFIAIYQLMLKHRDVAQPNAQAQTPPT